MGVALFVIFLVIAVALLAATPKLPDLLKRPVAALALLLILGGVAATPVVYVGESELGVVVKTAFGRALPPDKIIATQGEMGPQAKVLSPGWHWGYVPFIFQVETHPVTRIGAGEIGILSASDGKPLPAGEIYAPEWPQAAIEKMIDAVYFLGEGGGFRGPQATVLTPGTYRINPKLFQVKMSKVTNVAPATAAVVKSNVGDATAAVVSGTGGMAATRLVDKGQRGLWRQQLDPQQYYLNTDAYEVTVISTALQVVEYTAQRGSQVRASGKAEPDSEEREINVRSSDGFTFPVDVRVEFVIEPQNAPLVVSTVRDDKEGLQKVLNSAVRAIFRNSAEGIKALEYVQQRSTQERVALEALRKDMTRYGLTIQAVRIGNVGDQESLGKLLETQTNRAIALEEQTTLQEQQRTAEQKKALTRTTQEAEEEKRLATAKYEVTIAEQNKQKRLIEAEGEAQGIEIRAKAQAGAFTAISAAIGSRNAAMLELLKVVGERNINITPRVFIGGDGAAGGAGGSGGAQGALIGTMLDALTAREEVGVMPTAAPVTQPAAPAGTSGAPRR
ncbi:MAG: SPFH domain-containing protein [Phycisphaerales bacterium]